jgi:homoserine acetyltransferase
VATALRAIRGTLVGVGISQDALYGEREVSAWTDAAGARYERLVTTHGHDGFLLEQRQVARLLARVLDEPARQRRDAEASGRAA